MKFRIVALLFFNLSFSLNILAVKFYSINSLFGISIRVTNSICEDDNGFIWVSSKTGILRLTDNDYRIYQLPYETAGAIIVTLRYEHSKLIAYTNNGQIFSYNPLYDRFELFFDLKNSATNENFEFYTLLIDQSGSYWIALNTGLYKYQSGKLSLIDKISKEKYSIAWLDERHLIITKSEGIWSFDIQSLTSKCIYENRSVSPFLASSLFFDKKQNKIWIGTLSSGLFCYSFGSATLSQILQSSFPIQPILAIRENSLNTLLIGVDGQGVWELNKNGNEILNVYKENADDPYSLRGNGVYDIYCQHGKRVWICTISGGVSFFELALPFVNQIVHHSNNSNSLIDNDVNGIIEDHDGKIWFATNNGISCWNVATDKWKNFYFNKLKQAQVFLTLCEDDQGRIWAGSYSSGIYVLDEKTGRELAHYSRDQKELSQVSNFIFDIFKDSQGDLWIGGVNGKFVCYHSKEDKFRIYTEEPISSFAEISPGHILLGCSYGIKLMNKQTGDVTNFLSDYVVQDILVLGDVVWICASGEGLLEFSFKNGTLKKYTTQDGLPSNFVNSITYADNSLWLGTESGLGRFKLNEKAVHTFSSILPLSGVSYNKCAHFRLRNGQLVLGTNNGAICFTPQTIREISSKGKIYFQDLTISGRSIREIPSFKLSSPVDSLNTINLKYSQNTFSLELISIGMQSGSKFSWKLEGFEKDWSIPSENRIITYTNIPSGRFKLKIKMFDSSLSNLIDERSIAIQLIPPFWRTGWFWMLNIMVMSGIILLYFLYYINRLKQKHAVEKVRFFTNIAHDIRTSLMLIKAPVEELKKESQLSEPGLHYLQLAIEQARRLSNVVTQLMDFQKVDVGKEHLSYSMVDIAKLVSDRLMMIESYAKSKNIELVFGSDPQSYITAIDESKIEKVIDNLISNALKYSHTDSKILIDLKCDENKWSFKVKDYGIGISKKAQRQLFKEFYRGSNAINSKVVGSGIGLLLVKKYVKMHGGNVSCLSQENVGSTFQIVIPARKKMNELNTPDLNPEKQSSNSLEIAKAVHIPIIQGIQPPKEMKILIVEDNTDLLHIIYNNLSSEFTVFTAEDGEKAWNFILKHIPDLVISDVMMPNMDGFELCHLLKSTYETSHIPIILLTALSEKADQLNGLGLGADEYLTKPFDMTLLAQRIKTIIHNRAIVLEKALNSAKGGTSESIVVNELNDSFMKKMLAVIQAHISNSEFSKEEFASAMNVSSSLLYKKIKALTGKSPTDFVRTIRLHHALDLLKTHQYTITEVSELSGFASVGYFSTVFKNHYGKPPTVILK
jgi:signal transduction histidine kinase/DNA-binding response OmpR family regulator/ligand-binding sensor domain-containing protein